MSNKRNYPSFETGRGYVLKFRAVSPVLINEVKALIVDPPVPQYEMDIAGGGKQYKDHDESTLQTDDDRAVWAQYQQELAEARFERNKRVSILMIEEGIAGCYLEDQLVPLEPTVEWEEKRVRRGLPVPDDPGMKLLKYLETEVFGSYTDIMKLQTMIMRAGGDVPEDQIEQIEHSFRSALAGQTAARITHTTGPLETQQDAGASLDGEGLGNHSDKVPELAE
jgi:hypothetical protein